MIALHTRAMGRFTDLVRFHQSIGIAAYLSYFFGEGGRDFYIHQVKTIAALIPLLY